MAKPVKSNDPRKPAIVAALKKKSGGTKLGRFEVERAMWAAHAGQVESAHAALVVDWKRRGLLQ